MTTDQMFAQWISYLYDHPDEAERIKESWKKMDKEEKNRIRLIRIYPVYNGESETEAYRRTVRRKQKMPAATEMTEEEKMSF